MEPIISLKNASVVYGNSTDNVVRAVDDATFDIYPEEYVIFFGPSGCGKSTLMYTIAGLEKLTGGSIKVAGKEIVSLSEEEIVDFHRETIGMVFQAYYLIPSLRILQNVVLPQIFLSTGVKEREERGRELLKRFGIAEQEDKYPNQLSGGQQQRVAISRSLVNDPPILLADEPVGNLDSKSAEDVLMLLQELNKKDKKTIILVTHNPNHLKFAQRVLYMQDGKIIREVRNEEQETVEQKQRHEEEDTARPTINFGLRQLAKVFPNADQESLKRKMLTAYLLDDLDVQAEQRLEVVVGQFMRGKIDRKKFIQVATSPLRTNGIGFYESHAERLADKLTHATGLANFLVRNFKEFPRTYEEYQRILNQISEFIINELELHLAEGARILFDQAVKARLEGSITHDGFQDMLDRPEKEGGAGFNVRTAHNIARLMEVLLIHFDEIESLKKKKVKEISDQRRPHLFGLRAGVRQGAVTTPEVRQGDRKMSQNIPINTTPTPTSTEGAVRNTPKQPLEKINVEKQEKNRVELNHFAELKRKQEVHSFAEQKEAEEKKSIVVSAQKERRTFTPPTPLSAGLPPREMKPEAKPQGKRSWLKRIFMPNPQPKFTPKTPNVTPENLVQEVQTKNVAPPSVAKNEPPQAPVMHSMRDDEVLVAKELDATAPREQKQQAEQPNKPRKHTAHEIRRLLERGEIRSAGTTSSKKPRGIIFPQKIKHDQ